MRQQCLGKGKGWEGRMKIEDLREEEELEGSNENRVRSGGPWHDCSTWPATDVHFQGHIFLGGGGGYFMTLDNIGRAMK
jgi:hypothetical protein